MTTMRSSLGILEQVDLRTVWTNEADDFTPWLAKEENLKLLGDTIGLELELEAQEKNVGPFRADILCKETANDSWVLIENQLERTDHTHLGQLLTYAAGLNAVTIVWIAKRFTEEHRAAMDWLNYITGGDFNFFGLEVELWQIGDSAVAPKFNIACKPNDWSKSVAQGTKDVQSGALTESKQLQLEFWTAFREYVKERQTSITPTKPLPQHWMNIAIGRTGTKLSAIASLWDSASESYDAHELRAELVLFDTYAKSYYAQLENEKTALEQELREPLTWHNPPQKRMCRIYVRTTADLNKRQLWPEQHEWLLTKLEALRRVFAPRVKQLDAESYEMQEAEDSE